MNKIVYIIISILFFIIAFMYVLLPYFGGSLKNNEISMTQYVAFVVIGILPILAVSYMKKNYSDEYEKADLSMNTPKNKYGLYALLFFIFVIALFVFYVLFIKII